MTKNEMTEEALEQRRLAPYQHGGYSWLAHSVAPCNKCPIRKQCTEFKEGGECAPLMGYQEEKMQEIMNLPHMQSHPEFATLASMLVRELCFQALICRWLGQVGLVRTVDQGIDLQPIMKRFWVSVNASTRMMAELGLTPVSHAKLRRKGEDFDLAAALAGTIEGKKDSQMIRAGEKGVSEPVREAVGR